MSVQETASSVHSSTYIEVLRLLERLKLSKIEITNRHSLRVDILVTIACLLRCQASPTSTTDLYTYILVVEGERLFARGVRRSRLKRLVNDALTKLGDTPTTSTKKGLVYER